VVWCVFVRELRLTEAIHEPHICENILHYNVHAERKGSLRYAKGMSETMQTLHGLVYVFHFSYVVSRLLDAIPVFTPVFCWINAFCQQCCEN